MKRLFGVVCLILAAGACASDNGGLLWQTSFGSPVESLTYGGGLIYAGLEDGRVVALDSSGGVELSYTTEDAVRSLASFGGVVYASSMDDMLYALNASSGLMWSTDTPTYVSYDRSIAVSDDLVFAGLGNGLLQAYDSSGRLLWSRSTDAYIQQVKATSYGIAVVSDERVLYYAADGGKVGEIAFESYVRAADLGDGFFVVALGNNRLLVYSLGGQLLINRTLGSPVGAVAVDSGAAYAGVRDNILRAFSLNGSVMWSVNLNDSIVSVTARNGLIAASTLSRRLFLLDGEGRVLASSQFSGIPKRVILLDKRVIVGTTEGEVASVMMPHQQAANTVLLLIFTSFIVLASLAILVKSWRGS
jgi:outer membrane protein assembly factor BamB